MLNAVLFDLDNTLIRFSERDFIDGYVSQVSEAFSDIMPRDEFVTRLLLSTQALLDNDGAISNADYFMNDFCRDYDDLREDIWGRFMAFYEEEYDQFRDLMTVSGRACGKRCWSVCWMGCRAAGDFHTSLTSKRCDAERRSLRS